MASNSKVVKSYVKLSDKELVGKAKSIEVSMTNNPDFENIEPPLTALITARTDFENAMGKADNGNKADTVIKNNYKSALYGVLDALAFYVQGMSKGDEAIILNSGFDANKKPTAVGILPKPENVCVRMGGNKGSVELSWSTIPNARFYEYEYAEVTNDTDSVWITKTCTTRKALIPLLTSGKQYSFRVAGAASTPERIYSDEVISYVL